MGNSWMPPTPDTTYVGTYGVSVNILVEQPKVVSASAVKDAARLFDAMRSSIGTKRVPHLGQESVIDNSGGASRLLVRDGNVLIRVVVRDTRSACWSTVETIAIEQAQKVLRSMKGANAGPAGGAAQSSWCGAGGG